MIISLMHIHLAENVKLTSRLLISGKLFWVFSPYWENRDTSPLLNSGKYLMFCRDCGKCHHIMSFMRNENCKSNSSTRPEKPGQCIIFFRPFSVKTPREAGRGDEKKTPDSKSINNVTD